MTQRAQSASPMPVLGLIPDGVLGPPCRPSSKAAPRLPTCPLRANAPAGRSVAPVSKGHEWFLSCRCLCQAVHFLPKHCNSTSQPHAPHSPSPRDSPQAGPYCPGDRPQAMTGRAAGAPTGAIRPCRGRTTR
eukprot:2937319-Prymnesium_polylepis.4